MDKYLNLDVKNFARLFGVKPGDFSETCCELIKNKNFNYQVIGKAKIDEVILGIVREINFNSVSVRDKTRKGAWEKGWQQNLQNFLAKHDLEELTPAYFEKYKIFRLNNKYIKPQSPKFLFNFYRVYRQFLFEKFLKEYNPIYEFGCGTAINLVMLSQIFPEKKIIGTDWTKTSKKIIDKVRDTYNFNISGHVFNMIEPNYNLPIDNKCAFVTLNSMEQLGDSFEPFLQFIIKKCPALCINSEPILELYDTNRLIDYLAIKYHKKRQYLGDYLTRLKQLEKDNKIELIKIQRVPFGVIYHEAYSFIVWRPIKHCH